MAKEKIKFLQSDEKIEEKGYNYSKDEPQFDKKQYGTGLLDEIDYKSFFADEEAAEAFHLLADSPIVPIQIQFDPKKFISENDSKQIENLLAELVLTKELKERIEENHISTDAIIFDAVITKKIAEAVSDPEMKMFNMSEEDTETIKNYTINLIKEPSEVLGTETPEISLQALKKNEKADDLLITDVIPVGNLYSVSSMFTSMINNLKPEDINFKLDENKIEFLNEPNIDSVQLEKMGSNITFWKMLLLSTLIKNGKSNSIGDMLAGIEEAMEESYQLRNLRLSIMLGLN